MSDNIIAPRLTALGWTSTRAIHSVELLSGDLRPARVIAQHRDRYVIGTEYGDCGALTPGRARLHASTSLELPAVGDWVSVHQRDADLAIIAALLPRTSAFVRQSAGETSTPQVVAANIELALIATTVVGDFNPRRLERYAILAWESGATPVLLLTKTDLASPAELAAARAAAALAAPGVEVIAISSHSAGGLQELTHLLTPGLTAVILGSSGVGKSTLVNALLGDTHLATQVVRDDGRGRHTTTHRELVRLATGALLIDTPGMRELQLWSDGTALRPRSPTLKRSPSDAAFVTARTASSRTARSVRRWSRARSSRRDSTAITRFGAKWPGSRGERTCSRPRKRNVSYARCIARRMSCSGRARNDRQGRATASSPAAVACARPASASPRSPRRRFQVPASQTSPISRPPIRSVGQCTAR